jgi:protein Mpv17
LTKSVTAALVNAIGDILSQVIEAHVTKSVLVLNWQRLGTFFLCGGLYVGPFVHLWYEQLWKLGRWMERRYGCSKAIQTFAQLIMDQTLGVALFFPSYFYIYEYLDALVALRRKSPPPSIGI